MTKTFEAEPSTIDVRTQYVEYLLVRSLKRQQKANSGNVTYNQENDNLFETIVRSQDIASAFALSVGLQS